MPVAHAGRFTPAYAGNTAEKQGLGALAEVHPRIRGEYSIYLFALSTYSGSPPHTRGIPLADRHAVAVMGFTPAYAGNTSDTAL